MIGHDMASRYGASTDAESEKINLSQWIRIRPLATKVLKYMKRPHLEIIIKKVMYDYYLSPDSMEVSMGVILRAVHSRAHLS